MKITIGGPPGSGTSTVARIISKKLNIKRINAGNIWDQIALEKNTDVLGLHVLAEKDKSIDLELDKRMMAYAKDNTNILLEGRIIGALCNKNVIPVFKIWLHASLNTRAKRVCKREDISLEKCKYNTIKREKSDTERFIKYYNIDISNISFYDLVISSENLNAEQISKLILKKIKVLRTP